MRATGVRTSCSFPFRAGYPTNTAGKQLGGVQLGKNPSAHVRAQSQPNWTFRPRLTPS
jgi:hypothetical protein